MSERITRHDADGICTLTLSRPEKLNALDTAAFEELDAHITALGQDEGQVGCVVLRGAGRGFCAGADLQNAGSAFAMDFSRPNADYADLLRLAQSATKPAICGVAALVP